MYFKPSYDNAWLQRSTQAVQDMIQDPFWPDKQGSTAANQAILYDCGLGFIRRSVDGGQNWISVTPDGTIDGIPPASIMFVQMDGSYILTDTFAIVGYHNNAGTWMSWLLITYDNGDNWISSNLSDDLELEVESSWGPEEIVADVTGTGDTVYGSVVDHHPNSPQPGYWLQFNSHVAILSTTKIIVSWSTNSDGIVPGTTNNISARAGTIDVDAQTVSWGPAKIVFDVGNITDIYQVIFNVGTDPTTSLICYEWTDTAPSTFKRHEPYRLRVLSVGTGDVITLGTEQTISKLDYIQYYSPAGAAAVKSSTNNVVMLTKRRYSIYNWPALRYINIDPVLKTFTIGPVRRSPISTPYRVTRFQIISLHSNLQVCYYYKESTGVTNNVVAVWRNGDDFTFGPEKYVDPPADYRNYSKIDRQNSTRFVVSYVGDLDTTVDVFSCLVTNTPSNPTITFGAVQQYTPGGATDNKLPQVTSVGDDAHMLLWGYTNENVLPVTWSGATATFGTNATPSVMLDINEQWYYLGGNLMVREYGDIPKKTVNIRLLDFTGFSGGNLKAQGVSMSKGFGDYIWVTAWKDTDELALSLYDTNLNIIDHISLGDTTEAEFDAGLYYAYPFAGWGDDDWVVIFGKMNDPYSLGTPTYVLESDDSGLTAALVQPDGTWSTGGCSALWMEVDGMMYAIRNLGTSSKLYYGNWVVGLNLMSTLPFPAGVNPHAIKVDPYDLSVYVGADTPQTVMVVKSYPFIYNQWSNVTYDHGTGEGVRSLELL